ncbi:protein of unknown function [Methylocaldum szegediense]|uniref:Uncharacterized protein n=1 Tax=Methylocaldum szegediense TaxID=73780 RepID=A0ABM9HYK9_9GAMM|nr:protein of unknown function [Methylocaldum szegediense]
MGESLKRDLIKKGLRPSALQCIHMQRCRLKRDLIKKGLRQVRSGSSLPALMFETRPD